jgi:hypothetical protein
LERYWAGRRGADVVQVFLYSSSATQDFDARLPKGPGARFTQQEENGGWDGGMRPTLNSTSHGSCMDFFKEAAIDFYMNAWNALGRMHDTCLLDEKVTYEQLT